MADEQKTRTIGTLAAADVRKLAGWKEYKEASDAYTAARAKSAKCKNALKEQIRSKLIANSLIENEAEIDFSVGADGRVFVVEILTKKTGRQRAVNVLSLS
jgi:hypothetical protein